jgi:hypothetical protein
VSQFMASLECPQIPRIIYGTSFLSLFKQTSTVSSPTFLMSPFPEAS